MKRIRTPTNHGGPLSIGPFEFTGRIFNGMPFHGLITTFGCEKVNNLFNASVSIWAYSDYPWLILLTVMEMS